MTGAKPKQARAVETRLKIVEAAALLLAQTGYQGLNTNAIAKQAGVNVSTVYANFENKEAILECLLQEFSREQIELFVSYIDLQQSKAQLMEQILDALLLLFLEKPWLLAVQDAFAASPDMQRIHKQHTDRLIEEIAKKFPRGKGGLNVQGAKQKAVLSISMKVIFEGLRLAAKAPKAQRTLIMQELKLMVNSYLDNYR